MTTLRTKEDANERSIQQKNREAKESEQLQEEIQLAKTVLEEKIRSLEFDVEEKDRRIKVRNVIDFISGGLEGIYDCIYR